MPDPQIDALRSAAIEAHQDGRLDEARALYQKVLEAAPDDALALCNLGALLVQTGRTEDGLALIDRSLAIRPAQPQALGNKARVLTARGALPEALEACERALDHAAADPALHALKAQLLRALGRPEAALEAFAEARRLGLEPAELLFDLAQTALAAHRVETALEAFEAARARAPDSALLARAHGAALLSAARPAEALPVLETALRLEPEDAEAHANRAVALQTLGQVEAALVGYEQALKLRPDHLQTLCNLGVALQALGRFEAALESYNRAIALKPDDAGLYNNRGVTLRALARPDDALADYDRAISLRPNYADAHSNRGVALLEAQRLEAAAESLAEATRLDPGSVQAHSNLGMALHQLGRFEAAAASLERALELDPDSVSAHMNRATLLLRQGDPAGWAEYEWRWRIPNAPPRPAFDRPAWDGGPLEGRTLLLYAEQGFGDTLQFCRYAKVLAAEGARVLLAAPKPLCGLLESLDGVSAVVALEEALPAFDVHYPLMSLPLALARSQTAIPGETPYLRADPARLARWSARLGAKARPRVGLAWSGNPNQAGDRARSLTFAELAPHLPDGLDYVSLQKETRPADRAPLEADGRVADFGGELRDFQDTAALCALMDVVVSIDTSVAHLAGALGCPMWVMLSAFADWRWLTDREDSPWYPSARLLRQGPERDWGVVLEQVRQGLERLA